MLATIRSNRLFTFLLNVERAALDHLHLPFYQRLVHKKTRRHLTAVFIGAVICMFGSYFAEHKHHMSAVLPLWAWDAMAYSIHGIGLGPILAHVEPIWKILMGD